MNKPEEQETIKKILAQETNEYNEMEWQQEAFISQADNIMSFNLILDYVHNIQLKDKSRVYLVSEEFYLKAKRLLEDNKKA